MNSQSINKKRNQSKSFSENVNLKNGYEVLNEVEIESVGRALEDKRNNRVTKVKSRRELKGLLNKWTKEAKNGK